MTIELLTALESKVEVAIQTITRMRAEIKKLKQERSDLQSRLHSLLDKMEALDEQQTTAAKEASGAGNPNQAPSNPSSNVIGFAATNAGSTSSDSMTGVISPYANEESGQEGTSPGASPSNRDGTGTYGNTND